jgi:hypothetical protein
MHDEAIPRPWWVNEAEQQGNLTRTTKQTRMWTPRIDAVIQEPTTVNRR